MKNEAPAIRYNCPKCGGRQYEVKGVIMQHSQFTQVFSIPGRRYTAVICGRCRYTELYNLPLKRIKEAFDFIPGG
jgi:predicted nucleic-acid-binding Zn-ribbon protein